LYLMMHAMDAADDAALVKACRHGDSGAWEALVKRYRRLIYSIPRRAGLDEDSAADVFQRVFLNCYERLDSIEEPSRLHAWLVTTARRETWRQAQQRSMSQTTAARIDSAVAERVPDGEPLPGDELLRLEQQDLVRRAVDRLDERCRRLIEMLFYAPGPLAYDEVAVTLGVAEGSVGPIRSRCLDRLRKALADSRILEAG
jgi:RNA polymerase sigma factor (sigma-70 family)